MSCYPNREYVTLRLFGALRDAVGQREVRLAGARTTIKEVLTRFAQGHEDRVRRFIFDGQGNLSRSLILLLNDDPVDDSQQRVVSEGDVISLLLPLAGG